MIKIASLAAVLSLVMSACVIRERRDCREHEMWDGGGCHAEHGYEHYWDHDDHRDWHPRRDHHDDDDD